MRLRSLAATICLLCVASAALAWYPGQECPTRAGTVANALQATDGTVVTLDAVVVGKVAGYQSPAYIVVHDPWDCATDRLVVQVCPSHDLRLGMPVEVTGPMATVNGQRRLQATAVNGYLNADATVHYSVLTKPDAAPLDWTLGKTSLIGSGCPSTPVVDPVATDATPAQYYANIADCKLAADGTWVWLSNKAIVETGTDTNGKYYLVAADGSNDTIRVYTTATATTVDRAWSISGLIGTHDGFRTISTNAGPEFDYWLCQPQFSTFDDGKISWAKSQADGARVSLPRKVITASFPDYFYVGESSRICGIKVASPRAVVVGKVVNIAANMGTVGCERCLVNNVIDICTDTPVQLKPLGMTNRNLGAGNWAWVDDSATNGQIGVENGVGLNNIGMLVRVWGKVAEISSDKHWYIIDDGTGLTWSDGDGSHVGVKVSLGEGSNWLPCADPLGVELAVGDTVEINGISCCITIDGVCQRMVRQCGAFTKRVIPWWDINKINRVDGPGL